ncbi:MAG: clan AA aspartic protease, partial [Blastocatellia bacterium]
NPSGTELQIETIIDTGYTGFLTLPSQLIKELSLVWLRRDHAYLADETETVFDVYEASVMWDGKPRRIVVDEVDSDSLLGMSMLAEYQLIMNVRDGGEVTIEALP